MRCPTCRAKVTKDAQPKLFPFCSERCHLVDLGRWLGEEYRVPGEPAEVVAAADDRNDDNQLPDTRLPETRLPDTRLPETRLPETRLPER